MTPRVRKALGFYLGAIVCFAVFLIAPPYFGGWLGDAWEFIKETTNIHLRWVAVALWFVPMVVLLLTSIIGGGVGFVAFWAMGCDTLTGRLGIVGKEAE